jgi:soluble lytic murein transglycosylase-like protein
MRWWQAWLFGSALALASPVMQARGDVYMYKDARGTLHFTNAPAEPQYQYYMPDFSGWKPRGGRIDGARRQAFDKIIHEAARRNGVDTALVKAVIRAESDFVPHAVSPKGALGLMQLMPATARMHNVWRVFEPQQNVEGGVRHLRYLLDRYNGNLRLALAAYNAGEAAVDRAGGIPPYPETWEYLSRVLRFRTMYLHQTTYVASRP